MHMSLHFWMCGSLVAALHLPADVSNVAVALLQVDEARVPFVEALTRMRAAVVKVEVEVREMTIAALQAQARRSCWLMSTWRQGTLTCTRKFCAGARPS